MFCREIILNIFLFFVFKLIYADVLVCDNNECNRAGLMTMDSLFSTLNAIIESHQNTTKSLKELNEKIDHKLSTLTTEIENVKEVLHDKANEKVNDKKQSDVPADQTEIDNSLYDYLWIVVQRRQDGSVDFFRNWTEYKQGFGNLTGEFFLGLEKLYELTNDRDHELLIMLQDFDGIIKYAHYDHFFIGNETEQYILRKLGKYKGTAGDHMRLHLNMLFSTKDADNDVADSGNCAEWFKGAWWYYHCLSSNLNGPYKKSANLTDSERGIGITWGDYDKLKFSFKTVQMMVRAKEKQDIC